jgi:hypothetical protein
MAGVLVLVLVACCLLCPVHSWGRARATPSLTHSTFLTRTNQWRGGSSPLPHSLTRVRSATGNITLWITSNFGRSSLLHSTTKLTVPRNSTVLQLKHSLTHSLPGNPPAALQHIYLDSTRVSDDLTWGNITHKALLHVQLDLLFGTALYNKSSLPHSITQAIDRYIAMCVHEAYLTNKLTDELTSTTGEHDSDSDSDSDRVSECVSECVSEQDSVKYRRLYHTLNESVYLQLGPQIKAAQAAERDPAIPPLPLPLPHSLTAVLTSEERSRVAISSSQTTMRDIIKQQLILDDKDCARLYFWSLALLVSE